MEDLLKEYGFKNSGNYAYSKYEYEAVIWPNTGSVTISKRTPNVKRFLWSETYDDVETLRQYLKTNHN